MSDFEVNYSPLDKLVHNLAMNQLPMQISLSRIEDKRFDREHADITAQAPVFITSLPRAGTTLLLEILSKLPNLASHTYRDLPFLLCPLIWERISRQFRKEGQARERAHRDGLLIDYDSAEAFEEIVWRAFWPDHYKTSRILPWREDEEDPEGEFPPFLRQHMRKIIWLKRKRSRSANASRYLSKNNANIGRLKWLTKHFSDATIIIPYRAPANHIASLARQHRNFLTIHAEDSFVLRYMESIGHNDFGQALKPIDFDGWLVENNADTTGSLDFWADYWAATFTYLLENLDANVLLLPYDRLCSAPEETLEFLEEKLRLPHGSLASAASAIRPLQGRRDTELDISSTRSKRLDTIKAELDARALP